MDELLNRIKAWTKQQGARIHSCVATERLSGLWIWVAPAGDQFDIELGGFVAELDIELARDFPSRRCEVMQAPQESVRRLREDNAGMIVLYAVTDDERTPTCP